MLKYLQLILLFSYFVSKCSGLEEVIGAQLITTKTFMFWPNATVPFFVNPGHFDVEQSLAIMTALSAFAFKTCLKFAPVMESPDDKEHVMVFINPDGSRRCRMQAMGHSNFHPHLVVLGYDCLQSPEIDMIIMRALGFPFEHNRMSRDIYIDVMFENIETSSIELFTKDNVLPPALRALPYDINSVLHFGEREYSKNGHRTILFKNQNVHQRRTGLTATDLKKIEVVYGPECRNRDRQEKIELCQSYPGVARRKREVHVELGFEPPVNVNLRVNRDITPPPSSLISVMTKPQIQAETGKDIDDKDNLIESINALGIVKEAEEILEQVYKVSDLALKNAREKYCNITVNVTAGVESEDSERIKQNNSTDLLGILKIIADYAKTMDDNAVRNSTAFCQNSESINNYQRQCNWDFGSNRCPNTSSVTVFRSGPSLTRSTAAAMVTVRRKRSVADDVTAPKSTEDVLEKKKRKEKKIQTKREDKAQILVKWEIENGNSSSKETKDDTGVTRRFFHRRRFTLQHFEDSSAKDWEDESNISLNKEKKKHPHKEDTQERTDQETDKEEDDQEEKEIAIEIETTTEKKELVKKAPTVEMSESSESKEGYENKAKTVAKDTDPERDVIIQKYMVPEVKFSSGGDESEKAEEDAEERDRLNIKQDIKILDLEVEETKEKEVRLEKKNRDHMQQIGRAHVSLPKTIKLNKLNEDFYNERRWPDNIVRYVIKRVPGYDLEDLRKRLAEVNNILLKKTCVKLHEVDAKEGPGYEAHLVLDNSPDYVTGRVGGKQIFGCVELFQGGQHKQHTAMMVMAMLGFYFEVARHDRDRHIRVHMRHVRPDKLHHFEKLRDEATLDLPYDYQSATHPSWQFWRKIGKTGISTVATYKEQDPDGSVMRSLGQNTVLLSASDLIKINSVYGIECFDNKRASEKEEVRENYQPIQ